jgi:GntR family transcriptional regulator/MocR family aminotransferase
MVGHAQAGAIRFAFDSGVGTAEVQVSGGADFLQLSPASAPARGLTSWLADAIRDAIIDGRLRVGAHLPATRVLADELGVSRGVIVEAYQRLTQEGLVGGRPGAGTRVLRTPGAVGYPGVPESTAVPVHIGVSENAGVSGHAAVTEKTEVSGEITESSGAGGSRGAGVLGTSIRTEGISEPRDIGRLGASARTTRTSGPGDIREPGASIRTGGMPGPGELPQRWRSQAELDLSPGVPDLSGFPRAAWLRAERLVLERASAADLGYGDPRGSESLRKELAGWLARARGLRADPGDIIVVTGVAQALALLGQWLNAHTDGRIAMEDPGSRGSRDALAHWGLRPVPIPVDDEGLRVADLAGSGLPAVMLTPAHQFPTGVALAPARRRRLLDWAADTGALVIEDDYDAEYRYDRAPVPALQASAPGQVAYAGSTSKTLAPGLRLGWLVPPRRLHADLVAAKRAADLGSPALPQLVLAQLIASGELERHIRLVRKRQRARRDALLGALREHLPEARVRGVAAGLHLLVTFREGDLAVDDAELADRIHRAGVLVHPLSWHRQRPGAPGLVLGYAVHTPDQLREAARRIASITRAARLGG